MTDLLDVHDDKVRAKRIIVFKNRLELDFIHFLSFAGIIIPVLKRRAPGMAVGRFDTSIEIH